MSCSADVLEIPEPGGELLCLLNNVDVLLYDAVWQVEWACVMIADLDDDNELLTVDLNYCMMTLTFLMGFQNTYANSFLA